MTSICSWGRECEIGDDRCLNVYQPLCVYSCVSELEGKMTRTNLIQTNIRFERLLGWQERKHVLFRTDGLGTTCALACGLELSSPTRINTNESMCTQANASPLQDGHNMSPTLIINMVLNEEPELPLLPSLLKCTHFSQSRAVRRFGSY